MQKNLRQFQIHFPSENAEIYLIGPFNDWGKNLLEEYKFSNEKYPVYSLNYSLEHKTPYLFQINGKIYRDPSTIVFDENLNSVYWDFNDPRAYKQKYPQVNLKEKSLKILQTYLPGLITHFADKKGRLGMEVPQKDYYSFITNSGVIDKIKDLGFNGIQFLPVAKAIDGDNWKFRYLSSYPGSIEDHWGDPDSFAEMVDAFHEKKIAVFNDSVLSHSPSKDFRMNGISSVDSALPMSYFGEVTQWGTNRYKYNDPYIREFLVENTVNFIKNYKVDGFRIDNVDGILRFGENGEGKERPGARTFLRELNREIYSTN